VTAVFVTNTYCTAPTW